MKQVISSNRRNARRGVTNVLCWAWVLPYLMMMLVMLMMLLLLVMVMVMMMMQVISSNRRNVRRGVTNVRITICDRRWSLWAPGRGLLLLFYYLLLLSTIVSDSIVYGLKSIHVTGTGPYEPTAVYYCSSATIYYRFWIPGTCPYNHAPNCCKILTLWVYCLKKLLWGPDASCHRYWCCYWWCQWWRWAKWSIELLLGDVASLPPMQMMLLMMIPMMRMRMLKCWTAAERPIGSLKAWFLPHLMLQRTESFCGCWRCWWCW